MGHLSVSCPVCGVELKFKTEDARPEACAVCGASIADPGERQKAKAGCDYQKSFFGLWPGTAFLTDKRLFWVKGDNNALLMFGLVGGAVAAATKQTAGQAQVNVPLSNIARVEPARKGVRSGIAIHTKDGEVFKFYSGKLKNWIEIIGESISQ